MSGAQRDGGREPGATAAQAGKLLCVSETIFPAASRHCLHLVYRGFDAGGALQPTPQSRLAGSEFVDLRGPGAARPGAAATGVPMTRRRGVSP